MDRRELKEIIVRVINRLEDQAEDDGPRPACFFGDTPCDMTTKYNVGEES